MKTYQAELHFTERTDSTADERFFNAYIVGCENVFGANESTKCALDSRSAIAHKVAMEKRAFEWSQAKKFDGHGNPVEAEIILTTVFDNFGKA